jgi:hypothetical protein
VVWYLTPLNHVLPTAADTNWLLKLDWWPVRYDHEVTYRPISYPSGTTS